MNLFIQQHFDTIEVRLIESPVITSYRILSREIGPSDGKIRIKPKLSDFWLDLHQSLAHQGLAKSLDISIGMPALFANLATSRS